VVFCTVPGDPITDIAWRAAEILGARSGKRIAFVEDPDDRTAPAAKHRLITQIEWADDDVATGKLGRGDAEAQLDEIAWDQVRDLLPQFDFVIVNVAASAEDLVSLSREVDGAIVVVSENETRIDSAHALVASLRDVQATLLGVILISNA
jgi:hypothetical protein